MSTQSPRMNRAGSTNLVALVVVLLLLALFLGVPYLAWRMTAPDSVAHALIGAVWAFGLGFAAPMFFYQARNRFPKFVRVFVPMVWIYMGATQPQWYLPWRGAWIMTLAMSLLGATLGWALMRRSKSAA